MFQTCTDVLPLLVSQHVVDLVYIHAKEMIHFCLRRKFPFKLVGGRVPLCVWRVRVFLLTLPQQTSCCFPPRKTTIASP